ncbi:acyl-CoA dehydrogenase family protein [Jatrophihabitans sp.]|uniref:acyl-CoA dehydrogenase family protein n=1 Tax=Jatrophihabitans sp. TaxID=1932789 RepID=UPI0030C6E32E|nr:acyl-CoA dehydrogenase [Jatrophihabitans sp.]
MISAEQQELARAVRALLAKRSDSAAVRRAVQTPRGYDETLWKTLCEQIGVAALAVPEGYGGIGASLAETQVVLEELGRTLTPSPLLGSAVFAGQLLAALGGEAAGRLLPGIAEGVTLATVAWSGADGSWTAPAITATDGTLSGTAHYVLDGDLADVVLVVARDGDGLGVYELPGGHGTHTPTMDTTRRLATVTCAATPATKLAGDAAAAAASALRATVVAQTAEQVGAAARILELTVAYSKDRVQFGRPIGSFQALKHRMADLHVLVEAARSASYAALDGTINPSVAKAYCSDAFFTVAGECIQLHGGIAITWEHDAHLYFKRAHASAQLFGTPDQHVRALAPDLELEVGS